MKKAHADYLKMLQSGNHGRNGFTEVLKTWVSSIENFTRVRAITYPWSDTICPVSQLILTVKLNQISREKINKKEKLSYEEAEDKIVKYETRPKSKNQEKCQTYHLGLVEATYFIVIGTAYTQFSIINAALTMHHYIISYTIYMYDILFIICWLNKLEKLLIASKRLMRRLKLYLQSSERTFVWNKLSKNLSETDIWKLPSHFVNNKG